MSEVLQLSFSYIETAEFDPLRDEGLNYADALQQQGVTVCLNATCGTVHGYDANIKSDITKQAMRQRVAFLQQAFSLAKQGGADS